MWFKKERKIKKINRLADENSVLASIVCKKCSGDIAWTIHGKIQCQDCHAIFEMKDFYVRKSYKQDKLVDTMMSIVKLV